MTKSNSWTLCDLEAPKKHYQLVMYIRQHLTLSTLLKLLKSPTLGAYTRKFLARNPSYDLFLEFKDKKSLLNWREIQCEEPTFSNYVKFIVERDSVDFDWLKVLGRIPRFEEYMIYWETVKDFGEDELKSDQLSFRSILEQGRASNPS